MGLYSIHTVCPLPLVVVVVVISVFRHCVSYCLEWLFVYMCFTVCLCVCIKVFYICVMCFIPSKLNQGQGLQIRACLSPVFYQLHVIDV